MLEPFLNTLCVFRAHALVQQYAARHCISIPTRDGRRARKKRLAFRTPIQALNSIVRIVCLVLLMLFHRSIIDQMIQIYDTIWMWRIKIVFFHRPPPSRRAESAEGLSQKIAAMLIEHARSTPLQIPASKEARVYVRSLEWIEPYYIAIVIPILLRSNALIDRS